jgi:hypothetical protein
MIKFEHNMLVLNSFFSEEDVDQIDAFADYVREQERERIVELIKLSDVGKYPDAKYLLALIKKDSK